MPSQRQKNKKEARRNVLREGDVEAAAAITYETRKTVTRSGRVKTKKYAVALEHKPTEPTAGPSAPTDMAPDNEDNPFYDMDMEVDDSVVEPKTRKTQRDYILQFVERADDLLGALLSRESLRPELSECIHCTSDLRAVWRCQDCIMPVMLCRSCMRETHQDNPMHRIQRWTGSHFCKAELWEVGSYLLIPHHQGNPLCAALEFQKRYLESLERPKDEREQAELRQQGTGFERASPGPGRGPGRSPGQDQHDDNSAGTHREEWEDKQQPADYNWDDQEFNRYIQSLQDNLQVEQEDSAPDEEPDDATEVTNADVDVQFIPDYLETLNVGDADPITAPTDGIPTADGLNNSYIRVIHTNGLHHLAMVSCSCQGADILPLDLMASRLIPTSFYHIRTLFSAQMLDFFRLSNLELKASAYQFYTLLRRITNPIAPSSVVDLYNEFRRMTCLWRWMKKLKWSGFAGHNGRGATEVRKGELANYCPACPQVRLNLPDNWKDDPNRWVYKRIFVADGNFKADHVRTDKPSQDIWLSEGGGMIPLRAEYDLYLKHAIERLTGAPCENTFKAIKNALIASSACDITGIVAFACARHGSFAPNSMADLFKGEQQKNVDFSFLMALASTLVHPDQGSMVIYDIICQYFIYLLQRIGNLLPASLKLDRAIGMFHVHAHKDECFFRFAPTFIPGAATVCGEILESLWSNLNPISRAARTATLAHRAELLDDHACDSNHKKALGIWKYLSKRFVEADLHRERFHNCFLKVSAAAGSDTVNMWTKQIEDVEAQRLDNPKAMDVYAAKRLADFGTGGDSMPGMNSIPPRPWSAVESWLEFALVVEEKHNLPDLRLDIRIRTRCLINEDRIDDRDKMNKLREELAAEMTQLTHLQGLAGVLQISGQSVIVLDQPLDIWEDGDDIPARPVAAELNDDIHLHLLCLPSNGNCSDSYDNAELKSRIKQATGHLDQIRELIAEKSFLYSNVYRDAPNKGVQTRARTTIKAANHKISFHSQVYTHCHAQLVRLGADNITLRKLCVLKKEDVRGSTVILNPNLSGSTTLRLSWIWHSVSQRLLPRMRKQNADPGAVPDPGEDEGDLAMEGETDPATILELILVKQVHWLRARAQFQRWDEEKTLVSYEMQWTVSYFINKSRWWKLAASGPGRNSAPLQPGVIAYAHRQSAMWHQLAIIADQSFQQSNRYYKSM
ncbi:hypothetical protein CVT25_015008 [Psilocybe cyanescens]|uniref:CxC2-like cysteine cluster KDZ transposase-associated domain-containing protein n=1 Tax=Psilocybe cyanescens TaxID=93625 RepID=A0A409XAJ4_PSICY|nr:hypothetical protein CVT25_015008 [Psilocybe cyanescens]